jgi:uncharacterized protein YqfB (UPF0267 family)
MILGFKTQIKGTPTGFPEKILAETKIHTLREDPNSRWKAGNGIQFATGVRTNKYHMFKTAECKSVQKISIIHIVDGVMIFHTVQVDGRQLTYGEIEELAENDGFSSIISFFDWFHEDFLGKIIHWTDKRY